MKKYYDLQISRDIKYILNKLQFRGQGYIVGGYIRDSLLGEQPKDCDFVTDLDLETLLYLFKEEKAKVIGKHFAVCQITVNNVHYEIAKMRTETFTEYTDRKNVNVSFTNDIMEDLSRRDFTVNALAYDGTYLIGHKTSFEDIQNHRLQFIGQAKERILEDPLRILRAYRFCTTKDLFIDESLNYILETNYPLILKLSVERIRDELIKTFSGNIYKIKGCPFCKTLSSITTFKEYIKTGGDYKFNLAYYKHFMEETKLEEQLRSLKFSNKDIKEILLLFECFKKWEYFKNDRDKDIWLLKILTENKLEKYIDFFVVNKEDYKDIPLLIKDLDIKSQDLQYLGIPNYKFSSIFKRLVNECCFKDLPNCNEILKSRALYLHKTKELIVDDINVAL